ncbi:MAG TPA: hypothetical protein VG407_05870 [Caulobacteraceae bacterium]|jgi:hypothetical protein|nr:hypothetical protein [Caulobacteraceae bacterium]
MPPRTDTLIICETAADFRRWLKANYARADAVQVLLYKTGSGRASITWPQAIEEALCFGWIDGVRMPIRRRQLHRPLHPSPQRQQMEPGEHQVGGAPARTRSHDAAR